MPPVLRRTKHLPAGWPADPGRADLVAALSRVLPHREFLAIEAVALFVARIAKRHWAMLCRGRESCPTWCWVLRGGLYFEYFSAPVTCWCTPASAVHLLGFGLRASGCQPVLGYSLAGVDAVLRGHQFRRVAVRPFYPKNIAGLTSATWQRSVLPVDRAGHACSTRAAVRRFRAAAQARTRVRAQPA